MFLQVQQRRCRIKSPPAKGLIVLQQEKLRKLKQSVDVEDDSDSTYAPSVTEPETDSDGDTEGGPGVESVSDNLDQPVSSAEVSEVRRSRKRKRCEETWRQNTRKRLRQCGANYTTVKGLQHAARSVKPVDCGCRFRCTSNFTDEDRHHVHSVFWRMNDSEKKTFFCSYDCETNQEENTYSWNCSHSEMSQ